MQKGYLRKKFINAATAISSVARMGKGAVTVGTVDRNTKTGPQGLGGWLVLVIAGLLLNVILCAMSAVTVWNNLTGPNWEVYFGPNSLYYDADVVGRMYLQFGYFVFFIGLSICNFIFYLRKSVFFRWFTLTAVGLQCIFLILAALVIVSGINPNDIDNFRLWGGTVLFALAIVTGAVWIPYFIRSRRVKNTFRRSGAEPDPEDPPLVKNPQT